MISTIKDNNQIKSLIKTNKKHLIEIINKITNINNKKIDKILSENENNNDIIIYDLLNKEIKNFDYNEKEVEQRAKYSAEYIKKIIDDISYNNENLLDVGCGDCSITKAVSKILNFKNRPKCVDVEDWLNTYTEKEKSCDIKYTKGKTIDFDDEQFDIVMALHSLHHMEFIEEMINEIKRVIKINGLFIIKEHNCETKIEQLLIDVYHSLYEMVTKENPQKNFFDNYYAKYLSAKELDNILYKNNFRLIKVKYTNSIVKNYIAIYKKIDILYKYNKYKNKYTNIKEMSIDKPYKPRFNKEDNIYELKDNEKTIAIKKRSFGENIDPSKIKLSNISAYSVANLKEAEFLCKRIIEILGTNDLIITDATANVGGNTFGFAKNFKSVNAVEIVTVHYNMLQNNMEYLNMINKVQIFNEDYTKFYSKLVQDVIYIDPPWGGPDYIKKFVLDIQLSGIDLVDFVGKILNDCKMVILRLPFNYNFNKILKKLNIKNIIIDKLSEMSKTPHFLVFILS
jgi:ubiquinone/menaquinone biosynthesis C-methylase UbiE